MMCWCGVGFLVCLFQNSSRILMLLGRRRPAGFAGEAASCHASRRRLLECGVRFRFPRPLLCLSLPFLFGADVLTRARREAGVQGTSSVGSEVGQLRSVVLACYIHSLSSTFELAWTRRTSN